MQKNLFKYFNKLLSKVISLKSKSMRLRYILQNLQQTQLNNEFKSYFMILNMLKMKPSIEWQFTLYKAK